jgi:DNA adenine methylase
MKLVSPLRYPGGKAGLTPFLTDVLDLNDLRGVDYYEPYAGGAGAALGLLGDNVVNKVSINDSDYRIYAFWSTILNEPNWFAERIMAAQLNLAEWHHCREICLDPTNRPLREVGFASFYLNRCNRSGVINAGPIGGYEQQGEWRLGVRFTKSVLAERVFQISRFRDRIFVSNLDAIAFLKRVLPRGKPRTRTFVYLDPPYVINGQRLYQNAYQKKGHASIANHMCRQKLLPWVMSYDNSEVVACLYSSEQIALMPIHYSLQDKRSANELVIAPHRLRLPRTLRIGARRFDIKAIINRKVA